MSDDLSDFFSDEPRIPVGRGGHRPNAGPKPKVPPAPKPGDTPTAYQRYEAARAEKEEAMARQARVKADLDEGAVVNRQAVRDAAAKAFAACSQALDSIGDILEREGHGHEVAERVMELINAAKEQLATDLEQTYDLNAD